MNAIVYRRLCTCAYISKAKKVRLIIHDPLNKQLSVCLTCMNTIIDRSAIHTRREDREKFMPVYISQLSHGGTPTCKVYERRQCSKQIAMIIPTVYLIVSRQVKCLCEYVFQKRICYVSGPRYLKKNLSSG